MSVNNLNQSVNITFKKTFGTTEVGFSYDYKTKAVRYITSIDENKTIKSISADTTNHIIYFSTKPSY